MIRWNVRRLAEAKGLENPQQLADLTGISWPAAARLWREKQPALLRIEVPVLRALARGLKVHPWELLELTPDSRPRGSARRSTG